MDLLLGCAAFDSVLKLDRVVDVGDVTSQIDTLQESLVIRPMH